MLIPVIGLEVHIELATKSKMFCGCKNAAFGSEPNTLTCPTCLGLPGALPVPNKAALESTMLLGLALGSTINEDSFFERKNYFYPDLPKGYQISQYQEPLCVGGQLLVGVTGFRVKPGMTDDSNVRTIRINRIHQEEDTGKLMHDGDKTLVDFNRSGVPLTELVTEADFKSAAEAKAFLKELARIIRYLGISEADMEKGSMRLEANISVQEAGSFKAENARLTSLVGSKLNPKVEVKNINSFRFVEKAIEYEIKRQTELIESGQTLVQETRGYSEKTGETYVQRSKEDAHDYRYFPEPDIPPFHFDEAFVSGVKKRLVELPRQKMDRWEKFGVKGADSEIIADDQKLADLFDAVILQFKDAKAVANLLVNKPEWQAKSATEIVAFLNSASTKINLSDVEVTELCQKVIIDNPKAVDDYKKGKEAGLKFLVGQVMRLSKGASDVTVVTERLMSIVNTS
ncbi:MAG: Asp-tRNA(Asn)/Glu-tRNA(Gln) amidotransferase subunit GatB [candidate division WWE3 bacterium]|nr:Asp-tRNA(Asn)/Glu-tRNA(Gln) amidotransferase subunit GatB [candidate division WWE3 bacterium]